jgi:hypothetical protein
MQLGCLSAVYEDYQTFDRDLPGENIGDGYSEVTLAC